MDPVAPAGNLSVNPIETLRRGLQGVAARRLEDVESLSSGQAIVRPSDDPRRAIRLNDLAGEIARANEGTDLIDRGSGLLDMTDQALRQIRGALSEGLNVISAAENGPASGPVLAALQKQLDGNVAAVDGIANGTRIDGVTPLVDDPAAGQSGPVTVRTLLPSGDVRLPVRADFRSAALLGGSRFDLSTAAGRDAARTAFENGLARTDATLADVGSTSRRLFQARETHQVSRSAGLAETASLGNADFARAITDLRFTDIQNRALGEIARRTLKTSLFDFLA